MRKAAVYRNQILAGTLIEEARDSYIFRYDDDYFRSEYPPVSLTLSKTQYEHREQFLFPFFYNMLSEGANKALQNRLLRIDENDHFGLLLATAHFDTIGAVTVSPLV